MYATGSFGRGEASIHSDLDPFIVGLADGNGQRLLTRLDEIRLMANLIGTTDSLCIPKFSGDGEYLVHYTERDLIHELGGQHDDARNTFTARLLLLLESQPSIGKSVYGATVNDVIETYWRDYKNNEGSFRPAFLANDILRLWRTFCVNYEARTRSEPEAKKAKRRLKNYKLKHSRMLTCYSALLYLLAVYKMQDSVHPENALEMTRLSPTARLEWLLEQKLSADAHGAVSKLLEHYEGFLDKTNASEVRLIALFLDPEQRSEYVASANEFGDLMFKAIEQIGERTPFHRLLVV